MSVDNSNSTTVPNPFRVFLCHSSEDKAIVRALYVWFKTVDFSPWLDERDILPGEDWDLMINKAVRRSHVVIVCLSSGSITKEGYVQKEIRQALAIADEKPEGTIFLIPTRLEVCEVPDRLRRWQWVDLFTPSGPVRLMNSIHQRRASLKFQETQAATTTVVPPPEILVLARGTPLAKIRDLRSAGRAELERDYLRDISIVTGINPIDFPQHWRLIQRFTGLNCDQLKILVQRHLPTKK